MGCQGPNLAQLCARKTYSVVSLWPHLWNIFLITNFLQLYCSLFYINCSKPYRRCIGQVLHALPVLHIRKWEHRENKEVGSSLIQEVILSWHEQPDANVIQPHPHAHKWLWLWTFIIACDSFAIILAKWEHLTYNLLLWIFISYKLGS